MSTFVINICFIIISLIPIQCLQSSNLWSFNSPNCGQKQIKATERVIGGVHADIEEFPWQVSLQKITVTSIVPIPTWKHLCAATIIHKNWILTAAHCVEDLAFAFYPRQLRAVAGTSLWRNANYQGKAQKIQISEIIVHEEWKRDLAMNDIALLRTHSAFQFSTNLTNPIKVNSICLPNNDLSFNGVGILSGWGKSAESGLARNRLPNQLQKIEVPIIDMGVCRTIYGIEDVKLTDKMICAGSYRNGRCNGADVGDSGGALLQYINGSAVQIGIVSFSLPCKNFRAPDVYTNIPKYIDWIQNKLRGRI